METRAHYVLVGLFTLVAVAAGLAFAHWLSRGTGEQQPVPYEIVFEGRVPGLAAQSDVTFNGIKVGVVEWIRFEKHDPSKVRVRVVVARHAPITADAVAQVRAAGLTGGALIEITGGTPQSRPLRAAPGQDVPVIASRRGSGLEEIAADVPKLLARIDQVLAGVSAYLDDANRSRIASILDNVDRTAAALAASSGDLQATLASARGLAGSAQELTRRLDGFVAETGPQLRGDLRETLAGARAALSTFERAAANLDLAIAENRPAIGAFTRSGLPVLVDAMEQMRQAMRTTDRVLQDLERNPTSFFLSSPQPTEYKAP